MLTHLRVASGFSLQYGAALPQALVAQAAAVGFTALALTDRDSLSGTVRFASACAATGIAPIIGVDLALPNGRALLYPTSKTGWGQLCHLVSRPDLAAHDHPQLVAVLSLDSDVGQAIVAHRFELAEKRLARWLDRFGPERLAFGLYRAAKPDEQRALAQLHRLGQRVGVASVLTSQVRMARKDQFATIEILDALRHQVPLVAHKTRPDINQYLTSPAQLRATADSLGIPGLAAATTDLGHRLALDPKRDLGLGEIVLPDNAVLSVTSAATALEHLVFAQLAEKLPGNAPAAAQLRHELDIINHLGFASYFLTVAKVVELTRARRIRCTARGSGAGSLVNFLLNISGVNPLEHDLVFERFLSPRRRKLPDVDLDVESDRRLEVYDLVFDHFGATRVACVGMTDTTRVRHAIRDVGTALNLSPSDVGWLAKSFPHVSARSARRVLAERPELALAKRIVDDRFWHLVESLDSLPRHQGIHPCGLIISDPTLPQRTPLLPSAQGYVMSPFDKDDVEELGMIKLDVLGIRMQSALTYAVAEVARVEGQHLDLDTLSLAPDPKTFDLIRRSETLGCFQIESPGQRELLGKFQPQTFNDLAVDISLFRPGPVQADMVRPFLDAFHGWRPPNFLHERLVPILAETQGVIIFHEQVIKVIAATTGVDYGVADEIRRALGHPGLDSDHDWFMERAEANGFSVVEAEQIWTSIAAFGSFGFCKAHAIAFALPTYQSAWLKAHHSAAFLAGVLTHDPGMYPARVLLHEARRYGHQVLGVDVNRSDSGFRVERVADGYGLRIPFSRLKGISTAEVQNLIAGQPYPALPAVAERVTQPTLGNLVRVGAFDSLYPGRNRRDLLVAATELSTKRADPTLPFDFDWAPAETGLPDLSLAERGRAELDILGLDVSYHLLDPDRDRLAKLGVVWADTLLQQRNGAEVLVAGVKVATQTPPVRSGRRVIFLTLDDGVGLVDLAFFDEVQADFAETVFHSWLLLARGVVRRTGPRGISLRATGAWDLPVALANPGVFKPRPPQKPEQVAAGGRAGVVAAGQTGVVGAMAGGRAGAASGTTAPRKVWASSPGSSGW